MTSNTPPATRAEATRRSLDWLSGAATAIAALALLGLVMVQGWQVFARYVINDSPSWTEPVTILLLSTAMSLGAAAGVHSNRHFGFFLLAETFPPAIRRGVDAFVALVIFAIGAVLAYWSAVLLQAGWDVRMAGAALPQSVGFLPLALGGALMSVFAVDRFVRAFRRTGEGAR